MSATMAAAVYLLAAAWCALFGLGNLARRWDVTTPVLATATVLATAVMVVGFTAPPPLLVRAVAGALCVLGALLIAASAHSRYRREFHRVAPSLVLPPSEKARP